MVYRRRVVLTLGRNGGNQRPVTDRSRQVFLACLAVAHILWLTGLKAPTNWLANCQWYVWGAGLPSWSLGARNARRATNTQPIYTRQHDKDKPTYRCEVCGLNRDHYIELLNKRANAKRFHVQSSSTSPCAQVPFSGEWNTMTHRCYACRL